MNATNILDVQNWRFYSEIRLSALSGGQIDELTVFFDTLWIGRVNSSVQR